MSHRKPSLAGQVKQLRTSFPSLSIGQAQEQVARLNGYPSWNVAKAAEQQTSREASLPLVAEINVTDYIEYDQPEDLPEWRWIAQEASFSHTGNGVSPGCWEFMVRASTLRSILAAPSNDNAYAIPSALRAATLKALANDPTWVLFHQG